MLRPAARERLVPAAALACALAGLALAAADGGGASRTEVLAAARAVPAGQPLAPAALRLVAVDAADVTPSMLTRADLATGRTALVALRPGDYVTRTVLASPGAGATLAAGERAVTVRVDASGAPPTALLRPGVRLDVVVSTDADARRPARSVVAASALELLAPPRRLDGVVVVTLRAPVRQAVALTAAQSYAHDVRLLVRADGDGAPAGGVDVEAGAIGGPAGG